jgi:hypothetical protein
LEMKIIKCEESQNNRIGNMEKLSVFGHWKQDAPILLSIHVFIDIVIWLIWSVNSVLQEVAIARLLQCTTLSTEDYCHRKMRQALVPHFIPIILIGFIITLVYTYLFMDAKNDSQHPRVVFVWNALHIHFMLSILIFFFVRNDYLMLFLPIVGICQDIYCMLRTRLSELYLEKPATESFKAENVIYGCFRLKKKSSGFFLISIFSVLF